MERYCNFRSLIKYQCILGLITPWSYYSRGLFFGGSQVFASSETQGQSIRPGEKALSSTFVAPFLPTWLTATGSSRMRSLIGKDILFHNISYMNLSNTLFLPSEIYMYMYSCKFKTRICSLWYDCWGTTIAIKVAGFWWSRKQ